MGDILSAASLLMAVVAILYSLWYVEIVEILKTEVPSHAADKHKPRARVSSVLWSRMVPLFLLSSPVSLIFIPDALGIINDSVTLLHNKKFSAISYSSTSAALIFVVIFSMAMSAYIFTLLVRMCHLKRLLR